MTWTPIIRDVKRIEDLEVNSVYQVRVGTRTPRPMIYEGRVEGISNPLILGFMEVSPDMNRILSWRANRDSLAVELCSDLGTVVFTDRIKMEEYSTDSNEFRIKYPLLVEADMRFTL